MNTLLENKKYLKENLRKQSLDKRKYLSEIGLLNQISSVIVDKIKNSKDFINSEHIALYFPIRNELNLTPLLQIKHKSFYFPVCADNEMYFVKYTSEQNLKIGKYNIIEPIGEKINPNLLDLIIIPALNATKSLYRLGYGGGYYDKFFNKYNLKAKRMIAISKYFITEVDFKEKHDFKSDILVSEM